MWNPYLVYIVWLCFLHFKLSLKRHLQLFVVFIVEQQSKSLPALKMLAVWQFSLILLLASWLLSTVAGDAFRVISTPRRGTRGNDFFLRCQNLTSSSIGTFSVLNRPQFLRNGLEFSQDECMKDSELFSNGSIAVHVSPSCEGYIQCGTSEVLSPSFTLYGKYNIYTHLLNHQIL